MFKNQTVSGLLGLILGIAAVWWIRPDTSAGAVFIVVAVTAVAALCGALFYLLSGKKQSARRAKPAQQPATRDAET